MHTFSFYSVILANGLLFVAFIYGVYFKKLWNINNIRWFIIYLGFILGIEVVVKIVIYILRSNNTQLIYPFYIAGEFYLLQRLFLTLLKASKRWHKLTLIIACCIFTEAMFFWLIKHDATMGYGKIISHLSIVCMSAYLLMKGLEKFEKENPFFIVLAGLLLYYAASLFLFLIMNQLTEGNIVIWCVNNLLSSILYSSSIYTFYRLRKL